LACRRASLAVATWRRGGKKKDQGKIRSRITRSSQRFGNFHNFHLFDTTLIHLAIDLAEMDAAELKADKSATIVNQISRPSFAGREALQHFAKLMTQGYAGV
jgi:cytidylate kinase